MSSEQENVRKGKGLLDPRLMQSLGNMRVRARILVEGAIAGLHRSAERGASVEFTEYKVYSPGDDIRHIDWKTFGRSDRYYVKQFEDETNLRAHFVLDCSASMDYGFEDALPKIQYASHLLAALAYLLVHQGDAVGLLTFSGKPGLYVPPSARHSHLEDLLEILEEVPRGGQTDMVSALQVIVERARRRSLVFVLSDFLDTRGDAMNAAKVLRQRGFEVNLLHLVDPAELSLPFEGLTQFLGMEGEGDLLVDPDDIRERYQKELRGYYQGLERDCLRSDIKYRRIMTTTPFEEVLMALLFNRESRR